MPGINAAPGSPTSTGSSSPSRSAVTRNGHSRSRGNVSVAEIKEKAKDNVQKEARGASALTLLRTAKSQSVKARNLEDTGDLKGALDAITKAASLAAMFMDSNDFKVERQAGKHGVLHKEFMEFLEHDGSDFPERSNVLEKKLLETETPNETPKQDNLSIKLGGSIADRMRLLQDAGLSVATTKRFSNPSTPTQPIFSGTTRPDRHSHPGISSSTPNPSGMTVTTPVSSMPSQHALVPPSTLGPPSPTSSSSSSPQMNNFNISEFSQAYPTIDELDELYGLVQPSNASTAAGSSRLFPAPSFDPDPRPSSTPLPPHTINAFMSRPGSPAIPQSSNFLRKMTVITPTTSFTDRLDTSTTSMISPQDLHEYESIGLKVLILDVRNRADFDKEHIKSEAVVCLEPSVLLRENVNGQTLEDSLAVGPRNEGVMFANRDKFDRVAIYDQSSQTWGSPTSPLSVLFHAIYETSFQKMLKSVPLLIIGGLDAWKEEFGDAGVVTGTSSPTSFDSSKISDMQIPRSVAKGSNNPFLAPDIQKLLALRSKGEASDFLTDSSLPRNSEKQSSMDGIPETPLAGADNGMANEFEPGPIISRKPQVARPTPISMPSPNPRYFSDNIPIISPMINNTTPISYPQFTRQVQSASTSSFTSLPLVSPPPQASINPSPLSRRRSDYVDQSQEALSGLHLSPRAAIDYPNLITQPVLRRPPAAASSSLERQDNRPRLAQSSSFSSALSSSAPSPPRIPSDYPVTYWPDLQIRTSGLKNLGNTCYMNAPIQCLNATVPFARFFAEGRWKDAVNFMNPLGTKGNIARSFARLLYDMLREEMPITPLEFRSTICTYEERFRGSDQHDSQEFLSFLLDGIHEDLNRILNKPPWASTPEHEAELERLPQQIASEQEWRRWKTRNDSLIVDFFQGQFRNRLECMTCHKTSTTYDPFTSLALPVPSGRVSKVNLRQCLEAFVKTEVMEKNDAWRCPHCKELRKTTKTLSLSRLPPILIIHLKRFSFEGRWTDKIDTFVDFPMQALDLTNYMPPPLPPGVDRGPQSISPEDPRSQLPPYRYDLYAVTNHFGSLSSGHYTAFISSRGGWLYCDDSSVKPADSRDVVNRQAYMLFYKRTRV